MSSNSNTETIIIIDFGSQYSRLIARSIRELNVYCEIVSHKSTWEDIKKSNPKGIILSGGPSSVYETNAPLAPDWIYDQDIPVLGICYGMQLLVHQLGGVVEPSDKKEFGHATLNTSDKNNSLFQGISENSSVWMSHGDKVNALPDGFEILAFTENSPIAAMGSSNGYFGLQFHPEVVHTEEGKIILKNFVEFCGCAQNWTTKNFVDQSILDIRNLVKDKKVICALSGGVDSVVAASLVSRAIGDQLTCIFVNNGLMRKEEPERILDTFSKNLTTNIIYKDASELFLNSLKGVTDPEQKRKIIGNKFIEIFDEESNQLGEVDYLVQGTLYPDVIESQVAGDEISAKIKTHHNVGGLPEDMKLKLLEPLRYLFKDEVRKVGLELGLPTEIVNRQPFPGPGLSIRIVGEVTQEKLNILRLSDWIVMDEMKDSGLYHELWQSFAVLPDSRSVGVTGDHRTYGEVIAIRAVNSSEAMTADWARIPYDILSRMSNRICNEVPGVNRVVYDITSKPPGTIEWE